MPTSAKSWKVKNKKFMTSFPATLYNLSGLKKREKKTKNKEKANKV